MVATLGNAKALFGIIFLQYCSYAIFYILDELFRISPSHYKELVKMEDVEKEAENDEEEEEVDESQN